MDDKMKILVVDDEAEIRQTLGEILAEEGHSALLAANLTEARKAANDGVDMALVDIKLGQENGIDLLKELVARRHEMPVIMITGHGTVALAREAFRFGARDFLEKPLRLLQVRTCVRNSLENVMLKKKLASQNAQSDRQAVFVSEIMKNLYGQAAKLSQVKESVVILGPSGSGKELLARFLHYQGSRASGPFVATNASTLPVNLAEDELFGHEKGAFTGADKMRQGCIEQANAGTLFLDEIGDMDPLIQAKMLRVLEEGACKRLGGNQSIPVDVRFVCATHRNLEEEARQGKFRHDLWYRISAFVLQIPPLEQRKEDIPLLAEHFLQNISADLGVEKEMDAAALSFLQEQKFPGNVRELRHLIMRAMVFCESNRITADCLRKATAKPAQAESQEIPAKRAPVSLTDFRTAKIEFEKNFLCQALERSKGNITLAAQAIGMAQSNLSRKLKELGIKP